VADIKPNLRTHLLTKVGVTNHVSTRIYVGQVPQRADLPFVTISRISHGHEHHLGKSSAFARADFQIDSYAFTAKQVDQVSEAIRLAIDGFTGSMNNVQVNDCFLTDESDEFIQPTDRSERVKYRNRSDFTIWHRETVPTL